MSSFHFHGVAANLRSSWGSSERNAARPPVNHADVFSDIEFPKAGDAASDREILENHVGVFEFSVT